MKLGDYQLCHNGCQFSWYDNDDSTILGGEKLRVSKSNEAAKTLYKKFGFHVFDEDKEYLFMRLEALKDGSTPD